MVVSLRRYPKRVPLTMDLGSEFIFGAHRNRTVEWVLINHPSYIAWFVQQGRAAGLRFTPAVIKLLEEKKLDPNYNPDLTPYDVYIERHGKFVPVR